MKSFKPVIILLFVLFAISASIALVMIFYNNQQQISKETSTADQQSQPYEVKTNAQVIITKDGFVPETLTVTQNTLVEFTNQDTKLHSVASDPYPTNDTLPEFNSQSKIPPDGSYSFLFDQPGTWTYHDNLNPSNIQGTIIVE